MYLCISVILKGVITNNNFDKLTIFRLLVGC
jgi:hypothetical protein